MVLVVTLILLALVFAFVGYPLLRPASPTAIEGPAAGQRDQLLAERENTLAALKDLELEHSIGNLSREDYDALRAGQRRKAVAILREMDEVRDAVDAPVGSPPSALDNLALDTRLEGEIAHARRRIEAGTLDGAAAAEPELACPSCGAPHAPAARFCSECGDRFDADALTCPACGAPRSPRDKFCAGCGASFVQERQRDQ